MQNDVIYTEKNECQECCKCVRNCPIKAIKIINHSAQIDYSRCIACGTCVEVCPAGAQKVRNDLGRLKILFEMKEKIILSLAPSFVAEFDNVKELIAKVKKAGFYSVSETALGADIVSYFQKKKIKENDSVMFSTACPVIVDYIQKYHPEHMSYLSPYLSPLLTHSMFLKQFYGDEVGIVFAGPCIAKKKEADLYPEYLDIALTFEELRDFLSDIDLTEEEIKNCDAEFKPFKSVSGVVYPIEGGMVQTLSEYDNKDSSFVDINYFTLSGLKDIMDLLEKEDFKRMSTIFCEFLACKGGCISGSGLKEKGDTVSRKRKVVNYYKEMKHQQEPKKLDTVKLEEIIKMMKKEPLYNRKFSDPVEKNSFTDEEKMTVLNKIGIFSKKDMLDCGGCGYNTCEEFAEACLSGLAEYDMCVVNMKRLAQNKLNMLIKSLPLGVTIIDNNKNIIECNSEFIKMFVGMEATKKVMSRIKGICIDKFVKVDDVIFNTLHHNVFKSEVHNGDKIFEVYSFVVNNETIGMIFQDVTKTAIKKETVIKKAEEVIKKNLQVVQQIAFLLGENAADTEVILNSLIETMNLSGDNDRENNRN